jgi:glycerol uptake facilitator-like aquaporin
MNKYLAEFIGTFFLVLTIGCTVIGHGAGPFAPLAIGSALMVMIFAGGHISGGHFNPAVTLGVWLRGKCEAKDVAPYMTFQIMGGVLAALVVKFLKGGGAVAPLSFDNSLGTDLDILSPTVRFSVPSVAMLSHRGFVDIYHRATVEEMTHSNFLERHIKL